MNDNDLDNLFKQSLSGREETPKRHVWENIELALDQETKVLPIRKVKVWQKYAVAASLTLVCMSLGLFYFSSTNDEIEIDNNRMAAENPVEKPLHIEKNDIDLDHVEDINHSNASKNIASLNTTIQKRKELKESNYEHAQHPIKQEIATQDNHIVATSVDKIIPEIQVEQPMDRHIEIQKVSTTLATIQIPEHNTTVKTTTNSTKKTNLLAKTLNVVASIIDIAPNKNVTFDNDEEGSLIINVVNTYAAK